MEEVETYGLDPGPYVETEPRCEPILTNHEMSAEAQARMAARFSAVPREPASLTGYSFATLAK